MSSASALRLRKIVHVLYYVIAVLFSLYLLNYYLTGEGGPTLLAVALVPVTFVLFVLDELRKDGLYPGLGALTNYLIAAVYIVLALASGVYMHVEFYDIQTVRAGTWNTTDLVMGAIMALLIMEYARKRYFVIFVLNALLILYAVYGWVVPGLFGHPGLSWTRIVTAMSVETSTGVYSRLPQLALTLIGSFILVLSVLRAFGCVDSILLGASRIAVRSPHALPQSAVLGSFGVGMVSGSGAANAATTGSATIPAMIAAGMPRSTAASIETASSLGGQLMPPIMGISAFLMADFLGVSYFDVVARGYAPAVIYFISISISVYLLSVRHRAGANVAVPSEPFVWSDGVNLAAFAVVVLGLIGLMGLWNIAATIAALHVFMVVAPVLFVFHTVRKWWTDGRPDLRAFIAPLGRLVDYFASTTADLTLLLATLSIMTGAFVITGIPTKVGVVLVEAAGVNLVAMVLVAFLFGVLLGTGLPPAPTYILTALVIAPPMIKTGIDPWVVHFFSFFLAVWGELTPPTSVVAAVTAKIAEAPFLETLMRAIALCVSLFTLMAGVFVRPELVLEPGAAQLGAMALILTATIGLTFSIQACFSDGRTLDLALRLALAVLALVVLFYPSELIAALAGIPVLGMVAYWLLRQRRRRALPAAEAAV
ncbi:MAG TPA: TRAP transporter fused permease subunit [Candidatus Binatia bacterium]|nr:TRAP transporter fused permease subunit [Candidatus Binatia bacterium]